MPLQTIRLSALLDEMLGSDTNASRVLGVAVGLAVANSLALPPTGTDAKRFYQENHTAPAAGAVSRVNEVFVFDVDSALHLVRSFYMVRANVADITMVNDSGNTFFGSVFDYESLFSQEELNFCNQYKSEIIRLINYLNAEVFKQGE